MRCRESFAIRALSRIMDCEGKRSATRLSEGQATRRTVVGRGTKSAVAANALPAQSMELASARTLKDAGHYPRFQQGVHRCLRMFPPFPQYVCQPLLANPRLHFIPSRGADTLRDWLR